MAIELTDEDREAIRRLEKEAEYIVSHTTAGVPVISGVTGIDYIYRAGLLAGLERAANVCDDLADAAHSATDARRECARAIRARSSLYLR